MKWSEDYQRETQRVEEGGIMVTIKTKIMGMVEKNKGKTYFFLSLVFKNLFLFLYILNLNLNSTSFIKIKINKTQINKEMYVHLKLGHLLQARYN